MNSTPAHELLIMRHAKSSWKNQSQPDHDRPLNGRGRRDAPRMGRWLKQHDWLPRATWSSSAARTRETIALLADELDLGEVKFLPEFYLAPPQVYVARLRSSLESAGRLLVVGHNPGLELLLLGLTGERLGMPTAAIARVRVAGPWSELQLNSRHELLDLIRPKELPEASDDLDDEDD